MKPGNSRAGLGRFSPYELSSWPMRYGTALLVVAAATGIQFRLQTLESFRMPFLVYFIGLILVAVWAGFWPGILATVLSAIAGGYLFLEPRNSFVIRTPEDVLRPAAFAFLGVFLTSLICRDEKRRHELAVSEDRYRDLVEHSTDLVCTHDLQGRFLSINPAPARLLGYEVEELLNTPMRNFIAPAFRDQFDQYLKRIEQNGKDQGLLCVLTKNGEPRIWEYSNTLRTEGVERPIVRGIAHDVTMRKQAETALRESEQRLSLAQQIAGIGTFDRNLVTGENRVTPQMELIYGLKPGTYPKSIDKFLELVYPEDRSRVADLVKTSMDGGEAQGEWRVQWPDGSIHWITGRWRTFKDDAGTPIRVIGMDYDITERKLAEEALRRSEGKLAQAERIAHVGYWDYELDANRIEWSDEARRIYGLTPEERVITRERLRGLIPPEEFPLVEKAMMEVLKGGKPYSTEHWVVRPSGELRFIQAHGDVTRDESGRTLRMFGTVQDITDRKRAEEELRAREVRLQEFERVVEGLEEMIVVVDRDYRYVIANAAFLKHRERDRDEVIGRLATEILEPEVFEKKIRPNLERAFRGESVRFDLSYKYPKLGERSLVINYYPIEGPQGVDRVACVLQDVTEIKRADDVLRQGEQRFRVALQGSPIIVFQQDLDGRYVWVYNGKFHAPEEVLGKTSTEILGKDATPLREAERRVLEKGMAQRLELRTELKGKVQYFDVTLEPLLDKSGKVIGLTGASVDVAHLRELADRLAEQRDKVVQEKSYLESEIEQELGFEEIVGQSSALREVLKSARVVAPLDSTVLLLGESGTGKELVARGLHALSTRKDRTFIKLNCAAVPSGLLESELFGHEKGAFTGAISQKVGRIELADKGTLFLDEIGELPQELQPKLLRVLQDREFERLGGVRTLKVDVRIIAATNRDLQKDVAAKTFREDLFYRLNVFPIQLPTLRGRRGDIPLLVWHFVRKHAARMGKKIEVVPDETMEILQRWNWPGNVRELENMIERMVILTKGNVLVSPPEELTGPQDAAEDDLIGIEREHIMRILRDTDGVIAGADGAASRLGIKRTTLQSMLKRLGIDAQDFRRGSGTDG